MDNKTLLGFVIGILIGALLSVLTQFVISKSIVNSPKVPASMATVPTNNIATNNEIESEAINNSSEDDSEFILLYDGQPISASVGTQEISYATGIEKTEENLKKYNTKYYSYHSDGYMREVEPVISEVMFFGGENLFRVGNLSRLSVSKNYNVMPRTIEYHPDYYDDENERYYDYFAKIENYFADKDLIKIKNPPNILRVDLNGDGDYIYIALSAEDKEVVHEVEGFGEDKYPATVINYDAFDKDGNHLGTLLSNIYHKDYLNLDVFEFPSLDELDSVTAADLDNDSKMELIIESPGYEFYSNIYIYRYENGSIVGELNAKHYISA